MLPTDLRPEDNATDNAISPVEVVITKPILLVVHGPHGPLFHLRVTDDQLSDEDINLLRSSLEFVINKYAESIKYIKSKGENL